MEKGPNLKLGYLKERPAVALLLGEFIARWSLAETAMMLPLQVALGSPTPEVVSGILSATNSTEGKIKLLKVAVENMAASVEDKAALKRAVKKLEGLCEERNALCHHTWGFDAATAGAATVDFRKPDGPGRITPRSEDYLRDLCNRTVEAARDICAAADSKWVDDATVQLLRLEP